MRLRLGVTLFVLSWLPFAALLFAVLSWTGNPVSGGEQATVRAVVWGVQYLVGFVGLALVGGQVVRVVKAAGWRSLVPLLWHSLRTGQPPAAEPGQQPQPG